MRTLVVGVGSSIRCDDGVGVHVVRALRARALPEGVELLELGTAGLTLLDHLGEVDRLIVVDAIASGAEPGTLHELDAVEAARTAHLRAIHDADLPTALHVGRELMGLAMPAEVRVLAVEAGDLQSFSQELSPPVAAALPAVVARVLELLCTNGEPS